MGDQGQIPKPLWVSLLSFHISCSCPTELSPSLDLPAPFPSPGPAHSVPFAWKCNLLLMLQGPAQECPLEASLPLPDSHIL